MFVDRNAVLFEEVIEKLDPLPVFLIVLRIDPHNCMQALSSGVHEGCNRKFELAEQDILLRDRQRIRFDQRIGKSGDVLVFYALSVYRVKPNPCPDILFPVPDSRTKVIRMFLKGCNELCCRPVIDALARHPLPVFCLPHVLGDIADLFIRRE